MSNGDVASLLSVVACGVSIWMIILFVLLCGRVKAIKSMLMTVYGFEGIRTEWLNPNPSS
jgi:hypothetical protein